MKLFFKKILLFISPLVIIVIMMDLYLANMNSLYKEKLNGLLEHANEIEILILGNSHATYAVDPSSFSDFTFNIANVGQSIYFDKELTLQNLKKLKNLKYVLISLDYHSLYFSNQIGERNIWSYYGNGIKHTSENYKKADISPFLFGYSPKVSLSLLKKMLFKKWKYKDHDYYINYDVENGVSITDTMKNGFLSRNGTNYQKFNDSSYLKRINHFNDIIRDSNEEGDVMKELELLILELKKKGVVPVLISHPTFPDYNKWLDIKNLDNNKMKIDMLCKKFDVQYFDFSNCIKDMSYFFDPDHLNKEGAQEYSDTLNKIINNNLNLGVYKNILEN